MDLFPSQSRLRGHLHPPRKPHRRILEWIHGEICRSFLQERSHALGTVGLSGHPVYGPSGTCMVRLCDVLVTINTFFYASALLCVCVCTWSKNMVYIDSYFDRSRMTMKNFLLCTYKPSFSPALPALDKMGLLRTRGVSVTNDQVSIEHRAHGRRLTYLPRTRIGVRIARTMKAPF